MKIRDSMMKKRRQRLWELPPEEHAVGVYVGLVLGGVVLAIGTVIIFLDLLVLFQEQGFIFTPIVLFRLLLLMIVAYASMACFSGLFRMMSLQRMQVKKVDKEFKNFVMYARPLVEEVIKQRVIGEKISEKLDQVGRGEEISGEGMGIVKVEPQATRWAEFLVLVAILGNISVAIFLYLLEYPWGYVPYSIIILAVAWWLVMANFFGLLGDSRSYYLPAAFILIMPTLSIVLRTYMLDFQVLAGVFFIMLIYVLAMYVHFSYLATGKIPDFVPGPSSLKRPRGRVVRKKEVPSKLKRFLPPEETEEFEEEY